MAVTLVRRAPLAVHSQRRLHQLCLEASKLKLHNRFSVGWRQAASSRILVCEYDVTFIGTLAVLTLGITVLVSERP